MDLTLKTLKVLGGADGDAPSVRRLPISATLAKALVKDFLRRLPRGMFLE
jgi:hypothetical protein